MSDFPNWTRRCARCFRLTSNLIFRPSRRCWPSCASKPAFWRNCHRSLRNWRRLPEVFGNALRRANVSLNEFEGTIGQKSLNQVYRQDRARSTSGSLEGRILSRKGCYNSEKNYREWLGLKRPVHSRRGYGREISNMSMFPHCRRPTNCNPIKKFSKNRMGTGRRDPRSTNSER